MDEIFSAFIIGNAPDDAELLVAKDEAAAAALANAPGRGVLSDWPANAKEKNWDDFLLGIFR